MRNIKPTFVNYFTARANEIGTELTLDLTHIYPDTVLDINKETGKVNPKVKVQSEPVASVVMTLADALTLRMILDEVISGKLKRE